MGTPEALRNNQIKHHLSPPVKPITGFLGSFSQLTLAICEYRHNYNR